MRNSAAWLRRRSLMSKRRGFGPGRSSPRWLRRGRSGKPSRSTRTITSGTRTDTPATFRVRAESSRVEANRSAVGHSVTAARPARLRGCELDLRITAGSAGLLHRDLRPHLQKLHLHDRAQAVVPAYESGLVQPGATTSAG